MVLGTVVKKEGRGGTWADTGQCGKQMANE